GLKTLLGAHLVQCVESDRLRFARLRRRRATAVTGDDDNSIQRHASDVGQELAQLLVGLRTTDRRRGRDVAQVLRSYAERVRDAPQQQRQLCCRRTDVAVGLVDDDPAQLALRRVTDAAV